MRTKAIIAAAAAFFACTAAWAAADGPTATFMKQVLSKNAAARENYWHRDLDSAKAYAEKKKMPLVVVWSNGDACTHCTTWEANANTTKFKNYVKSSGIVWVFGYPGDGHQGARNSGKIYKFAYKNQTQFPLIRVYWPAGKIDKFATGDQTNGGGSKSANVTKQINYFKNLLKKYKYTVKKTDPYVGGEFAIPDLPQARLEAGIDTNLLSYTASVSVPFSRTNATALVACATNTVIAVWPDGLAQTNTIAWSENDSENWIDYDTSSLTNIGDRITLSLHNSTNGTLGAVVATSHITAVDVNGENSPKNPYWIGERTEDTLKWGEWTMDLDIVTNKVRKTEGSYAMALVGGSMWCPDCAAADYNCFERDEFRKWAASNKVALAAIDIPNNPTATNAPSLLTYAVNNTSERYWTCNKTPGYTNDALKVQSGAGYLARHGISTNAAAEVAARNAWIVGHHTLDGGWNRPERENQRRTGVPMLVLLRDDGSIAARFNRFSDVGPVFWSDGYLKRFEEMFAQIGEPDEESNDSWTTTRETFSLRGAKPATVSFVDQSDVYKLDGEDFVGKRMEFTAKGGKDVKVEIKLLSSSGSQLASAAGSLAGDGVSLAHEIPEPGCFVAVGPAMADKYPVDPYFAHTNLASTVAEYTLESDFVVVPAEVTRQASVPEGTPQSMRFELKEGSTYRITNLDAEANAGVLEPVEGKADFYKALKSGNETLALTSGSLEYQVWRPGKTGFQSGSAFVKENGREYSIQVVRTGGLSGTVSATVKFDFDRSSKYDELFEIEGGCDPKTFERTFTWEEGSNEVNTVSVSIIENNYCDGDQRLYFTSKAGGAAEDGVMQFCLTIRDDDKLSGGRLAIESARPAISGNMRTIVRAGHPVYISVARGDGFDGELSAKLESTAGTITGKDLLWGGRERDVKEAMLDLSGVAAGKKIKVSLVPAKGTAVDAKRRVLTVETVAENAPGFEVAQKLVQAARYMPLPDGEEVALDEKATDSTTVKLFSGSLPPGVKWRFDKENKKIVFEGVPSKAGDFTASFRAYEGKTAGLAVAVSFKVLDPAVEGGGAEMIEPFNATIAKTRTFADVPFFNSDRLAGVATLTLPRTGRASAKCRLATGETVSLSSKCWTDANESDRTMKTVLSDKSGEWTLAVAAGTNGTVAATLANEGESLEYAAMAANVWNKNDTAADFKGYYTVSLPVAEKVSGSPLATGYGYLTIKFNTANAYKTGKATVAGMLPSGKTFSTSAVLQPGDKRSDGYWMKAVLPLIVANSEDVFSGALRIAPGTADAAADEVDENGEYATGRAYYKLVRRSVFPECGIFWKSNGRDEATTYELKLDAYGGYYNSAEDFATCCNDVFQTTSLKLFALDGFNDASAAALPGEDDDSGLGLLAGRCEKTPPGKGDTAPAVTSATVKYAKLTSKAKTKTNQIVSGDKKLTFALSTGIVSGTFTLPFESGNKTVSYRAVVMPRWGSADCTDCGNGGADATKVPFISGSAFFIDEYDYIDGKGREKTAKARRSCPVTVGLGAGE